MEKIGMEQLMQRADEDEHKRLTSINGTVVKPMSDVEIRHRSKKHSARMLSLQQPHAGDWLLTAPTDRMYTMRDEHMRLAVRQRLGLNLFPDLSNAVCACGVSLVLDADHFQNCNLNTKNGVNVRHDSVAHCLHRLARQLSLPVEAEPKYKSMGGAAVDGRKRPDLIVTHPQTHHTACIDVSITNPTAVSALSSAMCNVSPCVAAKAREEEKRKKYQELCDRAGHEDGPVRHGEHRRVVLVAGERTGH